MDSAYSNFPNYKLKFGSGSVASCWKDFSDYETFKQYCEEDSSRAQLRIFKQFIDDFEYLSIFGNPDVTYGKDWIEVIRSQVGSFEAGASATTKGTIDETARACTLFSGMEIEIITSKLGKTEDPQTYIVGAEMRGIQEEWIYHPNQTKFQHTISVTYREILPMELNGQFYSLLDRISGSLFYFATLKTGATMPFMISVGTVVVALSTLIAV